MWLPKRFFLPRNILTLAFSFLLPKRSPRCWIRWLPTTPGMTHLSKRGLYCNKYEYQSLFDCRKHAIDFFLSQCKKPQAPRLVSFSSIFRPQFFLLIFYFIYWESKVHVDRKSGKKLENMDWENFKNYIWNYSCFWSSILIFVGFFHWNIKIYEDSKLIMFGL